MRPEDDMDSGNKSKKKSTCYSCQLSIVLAKPPLLPSWKIVLLDKALLAHFHPLALDKKIEGRSGPSDGVRNKITWWFGKQHSTSNTNSPDVKSIPEASLPSVDASQKLPIGCKKRRRGHKPKKKEATTPTP